MGTRILLISDNAAMADALTRGLREEGFSLVHVADGETGRHRLHSESWDMVLLDCWPPGIDGLTLLREPRRRDADTRVLMLTARDAVSTECADWTDVPATSCANHLRLRNCWRRIRLLSRRPIRQGTTLLSYEDLSVDLIAQRVERNGNRLD